MTNDEIPIYNVDEFVAKLRETFVEYSFEPQAWGMAWYRIWVKTKGGVQLGRINLAPMGSSVNVNVYRFYNVKWYKPGAYEYDSRDNFFLQIDHWMRSGELLDIPSMVKDAIRLCDERKKAILEYRRANPIDRRRKAIKQNWTSVLHRLVREKTFGASMNSESSEIDEPIIDKDIPPVTDLDNMFYDSINNSMD